MFDTDPKWASLNATVHVVQRAPEVFTALKSWGILGNIKGQRHGLTFSGQEKIEALHEDHLRLAEHASVAGHIQRVAAFKELPWHLTWRDDAAVVYCVARAQGVGAGAEDHLV